MNESMITRIKQVISIIQQEKDIEEIEYDDTKTGTHIKVKRCLTPTDDVKERDRKILSDNWWFSDV